MRVIDECIDLDSQMTVIMLWLISVVVIIDSVVTELCTPPYNFTYNPDTDQLVRFNK